MKNNIQIVIFFFVLFTFTTCNSPVGMGGASGTDVGICKVEGTVVDTLGQPLPGSLIRLRPVDYIVGSNDTGIIKRDVLTDADSRFTLEDVPVGHYLIECLSPDSSAQVVTCIIDSSDSVALLPPVKVFPMSIINGSASGPDKPPERGLVQVFGMERSAEIDSNGNFKLRVPSGWCHLNLHGIDPEHPDIDTVMYFKPGPNDMKRHPEPDDFFCKDIECELSVVRKLLDTNHLDSIAAESVVTIENNHIVALKLHGLGLTILPESIFRLTSVRILDIGANALNELPHGMDRFRKLEKIFADHNSLWTIDASIGNIDSLRVLDLSNNRLQSLPEPITYLKPDYLNLGENMLCNIGELTRKWLDQYDPHWRKRQACR